LAKGSREAQADLTEEVKEEPLSLEEDCSPSGRGGSEGTGPVYSSS